jgi:hypothetical protein
VPLSARDEERRDVAIRSCFWGLGAVLPINAQLWSRSHRRVGHGRCVRHTSNRICRAVVTKDRWRPGVRNGIGDLAPIADRSPLEPKDPSPNKNTHPAVHSGRCSMVGVVHLFTCCWMLSRVRSARALYCRGVIAGTNRSQMRAGGGAL